MARSRRSTRRTRQARAGQPASDGKGVARVHRDMVREEVSHMSPAPERPLKKRRVAGNAQKTDSPPHLMTELELDNDSVAAVGRPPDFDNFGDGLFQNDQLEDSLEQTVFNDSESSSDDDDDEEENEYDWEQILADGDTGSEPKEDPAQEVSIDLSGSTPSKRSGPRRLPGTAAQKRLRIDAHKCHFLTLLLHVYIRSYWCNDKHVQSSLRPLLNKRIVDFVTPNPGLSQFDQSSRFIAGLEDVSKVWRGAFKIQGVGMRSSSWALNPSILDSRSQSVAASEPSVDHASFVRAAKDKSGSRDVGAQLFCALLRAIGVDARLVCSLQPLPFTAGPTPVAAPSPKPTIDLSSPSKYPSYSIVPEEANEMDEMPGPPRVKRFGGRVSRGREPIDLGRAPEAPAPVKPGRSRESTYPIFWVEAFNRARQTWVPVDPLVTQTVSKPAKLEPPASDSLNSMSYVICFEEDGTARDVTKRYTKAYNAKTRKHRVDANEDGRRWLRKAMKMFRGVPQDRDAIEDAEFLKREGQEPMPRNIQDFKDHPFYALERHLRRDEVIHPRREVGKLAVGKTAEKVEPVFRRSHVIRLRSAEKWTRLGREIQPGAQPLKRVHRPRRPRRSLSEDSEQEQEDDMGLYALHQTDIYVPPPILRGQVPKNRFGNIELFVQTMIPPRAVHIRASDGVLAARTLGIDFAQAVTGFKFKGRQGTAIVYGVIVAREYREAMEEVITGLHYQQERAEAAQRTANNLRMWKRLLTGIRIRARIMEEHGRSDEHESSGMQDAIDDAEYKEEKSKGEGGFMLDKDQPAIAEPTASTAQPQSRSDDNAGLRGPQLPRKFYFEPTVTSPWDQPGALGGGASNGDADVAPSNREVGSPHGAEAGNAGGFLATDDDDGGGGFIVDEARSGDGDTAQQQDTIAYTAANITSDAGGAFVVEDVNKSKEASPCKETQHESPIKHIAPEVDDISPGMKVAVRPEDEDNESPKIVQVETSAVDATANNQEEGGGDGDNDDGSDFGEDTSLLSHDPEDDDAEPEWLFYNTTL